MTISWELPVASEQLPDEAGSDPSGPEPAFRISPRDYDLMIRTVAGEAANQPDVGQVAVGHVILNRLVSGQYGGTIRDVVHAPNQFEPWQRNPQGLLSMATDAPQYVKAQRAVDAVLSGEVPDPTEGATHFYAPKAQAALGRQPPKWGREGGREIFDHTFFAPNGPVAAYATLGGKTTGSQPKPPAALPAAPRLPGRPEDMADDELEALLTGGLAGRPAQSPAGGRLPVPGGGQAQPSGSTPTLPADGATPLAVTVRPSSTTGSPAVDPSSMSDADLEKLLTGGGGAPEGSVGPKGGAPSKATGYVLPPGVPAHPSMVTGGAGNAETGELVTAGKPFTDNGRVWGGFNSLMNGLVLSAGPAIQAGAAAVKEKLTSGGDLGALYSQARSAYGAGQAAYAAQNPTTNSLLEAAGSVAPTVAATVAGGGALAAGGNRLMAAAGPMAEPYLAAAGRFVSGQAGRGVPATATTAAQAGSLPVRALSQGVAGSAAGAAGGALNTGLTGGNMLDNAASGAIFGAGTGAAMPALASAGGAVANKLIGQASPETAALAQLARDQFRIPVRAGQMAESPAVRFTDSTLSRTPMMGYRGADQAQQVALNRAVANEMGVTADKVTADVMARNRTRLGQSFDDIARQSGVRADNQLAGDLSQIFADAGSALQRSELGPLQNQVRAILEKFGQQGVMNGEAYQAITRKGSPLDVLMHKSNPNIAHYAGRIRDAIDDARERTVPAALTEQLRQTRYQYKVMKTIEDLVEKSPSGDISSAALMGAVRQSFGDMAYSGGGRMGDLARIGQRFLKEPPSSGTAERIAASGRFDTARNVLQSAGGMAGAAAGFNQIPEGFGLPAAAAAAGATILPFVIGRGTSSALRSDWLTNRLIQAGTGGPMIHGPNALMQFIAPAAADYNRLAPPRSATR